MRGSSPGFPVSGSRLPEGTNSKPGPDPSRLGGGAPGRDTGCKRPEREAQPPQLGNREPGTERGPIRILCVGNPLMGDDGVGIALARRLAGAELPDGVEGIDGGTGGLTLLDEMAGAAGVILVDAGAFGRPPGTILRLPGEKLEPPDTGRRWLGSHAGLGGVLALGRELDSLPPLVLYLVQAGSVTPGVGLSPPVDQALAQLFVRVLAEARSLVGSTPASLRPCASS